MLPIIIAGGIGAAATLLLLNKLKKKRLAILGERGTGKTTLINFLTTGTIPVYTEQTLYPKKVDTATFKLKDLDLTFNTTDVPGSMGAYGEWKISVEKSDIVIYLLRADHLLDNKQEAGDRVKEDIEHICGWLDESKNKNRPFFIIGTHCDLDREFSLLRYRLGDYQDRFRRLPVVKDIELLTGGTAKMLLGSLVNTEYAEDLVYHLLLQLENK